MYLPKGLLIQPAGSAKPLHDEKFVDDTTILSLNALKASIPTPSFPKSKRELSIKKFKLSVSTYVYENWPSLWLWHFVQQNFR